MRYFFKAVLPIFICLFFVVIFVQAQQLSNINGQVIDTLSKQPVDFASVSLLSPGQQPIAHVQTDEKGNFTLKGVAAGNYIIRVSFLGYERYERKPLFVTAGQDLHLGTIHMKMSRENVLREVVIEGQAPAMEVGIDRKVFDVSQSIVSAGGTATDLLQNVPSLSVDMDGNVGLRGSSNVRILIDGRPSALAGSNINNLLESLPANSVQRIEVMSNPSSKYDPEGQGGIINIILKKNMRTGFNGMVRGGGGSYSNFNGGLDLNYRDTKFNYFGGYNYNRRSSPGNGYNDNRYANGSRVYNTSENDRKGNSHMVRLGADYFINEKTTIGLSGNMNIRDNIRTEDLFYTYYSTAGSTIGNSTRYTRQDEDDLAYDASLDFKREFKREGEELAVNVAFGRSKEDGIQTFDQFATDPSIAIDNDRINDTKEDNKNTNIQIDYTLPFSEQQKLEAGYRTSLRYGDEQQLSDVRNVGSGLYERDYDLTNDFNLEDMVHALYANYQNKLTDKLGYQVGLRAEQAYLNTEYFTYDPEVAPEDRTASASLDYFRIYPSIYITQELAKDQSLQLSYTRRVNRPNGWQVNPFVNVSDPLNLRQGNPSLMPEDIHSMELGYNKKWDKVSLTSTVYHRITNDVIQMIVDSASTETNATFSSFQNISRNNATGLELISQFTPSPKVDFMANVNGNYLTFDGSEQFGVAANSGFNWDVNLTANGRIAKGLTAQLRGEYMAPRVMAQGKSFDMLNVDAGVKLSVLKDKGSLMLNVRDIFNQRRFGGEQFTAQFNREFQRRMMQGPMAMLTFSYRFGMDLLGQKDEKAKRNGMDEMSGGEQF